MGTCKQWLRKNLLLLLTVAAVIVGVGVGFAAREAKPSQSVIEIVAFPGELFMRMLQMAVLPLITSSIMSGLASLDPKTSKRVFVLSFAYYFFTTAVAIALGIVLVVAIGPGYRTKLEQGSGSNDFMNTAADIKVTTRDTVFDMIRNLFPENVAEACIKQYRTVYKAKKQLNEHNETTVKYEKSGVYANNINILGIITISILAGTFLGQMKGISEPLMECLSAIDHITMKMIMMTMWYSPIGITSLIIGKVLELDDVRKTLSALGYYMMTVIIGLIIQMFIIQPLLYTMLTRKNPFIFMKGLIQVWLTALVTSSSAATLPVTIQCCEQNLNIDKRISRFVLPVGATVNMNGAALYEAVSAIFVAQLVGWELNAARLLVVGLTATFGSIGAAAVPSAGVVTLVIVLNALGLGTQHMAMFIAVDWFIDRVRTSVNVIGDAYAAGVVQHYCTKVLEQMDGDGSKTGSSDTVTHTSTEKTDEDRKDGTITASNSGQEDSSEGST